MPDQLALAELGAAALLRSRAEALAVARKRVLSPHAPNTQRAYRGAIGQWCAYADALGLAWAPIDPEELRGYLEVLSKRCAPNTVRLHFSALCSLDQAARVTPTDPNPASLRTHVVMRRWEESWSREHPRRPRRRAAALEPNDLVRMLQAIAERPKNASAAAHVLQAARDRCLLLFGVCGAFRGADVRALELAHVEVTERGLRLLLPRSKTDQQGEGHTRALLPQGREQLCPVAAFTLWRRARGDASGALFPATSRAGALDLSRGLSERQITRLVAQYAARAGLERVASAHSMRATFATLASRAGKSLDSIMAHAGWRTADVAVGYMRTAQLFDDNPTGGLLD